LSTPMKRVTEMVYIWVKRKMRAEGRGPARENSRNSWEMIRMAAISGDTETVSVVAFTHTDTDTDTDDQDCCNIRRIRNCECSGIYLPMSLKSAANTLMSEVTYKYV